MQCDAVRHWRGKGGGEGPGRERCAWVRFPGSSGRRGGREKRYTSIVVVMVVREGRGDENEGTRVGGVGLILLLVVVHSDDILRLLYTSTTCYVLVMLLVVVETVSGLVVTKEGSEKVVCPRVDTRALRLKWVSLHIVVVRIK